MQRLLSRLILFTVGIFYFSFVFAQNKNPAAFYGKTIDDLVFNGLKNVPSNEIYTSLGVFLGKELSASLLREMQVVLYSLDYFEGLIETSFAVREENSVQIIFNLKEKDYINDILFEGNENISTGDLLKQLNFKKKSFVSGFSLEAAKSFLNDFYNTRGFFNVQITYEVKQKNDSLDILFKIIEGQRQVVKGIDFVGNNNFSDKILRKQVKTKIKSLFDQGVFKEASIEEDRQSLITFYREKGYLDATVSLVESREEIVKNQKQIVLVYRISEGRRFLIRSISFVGNQIFNSAELLSKFDLKKDFSGKEFASTKTMEEGLRKIGEAYYEEGYIFNQYDLREVKEEEQVDYTLVITENVRARIRAIILEGNEKTKAEVIRRELKLKEGDYFNGKLLGASFNNIFQTGHFENIVPNVVPLGDSGEVDIVIGHKEKNTINFQLAGSISFSNSEFPLSGVFGIQDSNFLGRGFKTGITLDLSPLKQNLNIFFEEPWLFKIPLSLRVDLTYSHAIFTQTAQNVLGVINSNTNINSQNQNNNLYPYDEDIWVYSDGPSEGSVVPFMLTQEEKDRGKTNSGDKIISKYDYDNKNGVSPIPSSMLYEEYSLNLGVSLAYLFRTSVGNVSLGTGLTMGISYLNYDKNIYFPSSFALVDGAKGWMLSNYFILNSTWTYYDKPWSPENGFALSQKITFAGFFAGASHFVRFDTSFDAYWRIINVKANEAWSWKVILKFSLGLSAIVPSFTNGGQVGTQIKDLVYIDGVIRGRGWDLLRGYQLLYGSVSLRMPLYEKFVWLDGFFDLVAITERLNQNVFALSADQYRMSAGFGLRLSLPGFPLAFYLVKGFRPDGQGGIIWQKGNNIFGEKADFKFIISIVY